MYMQYITTTELRTKSAELVDTLEQNGKVSLIHRSKVIGVIEPIEAQPKALTEVDIEEIRKAAKELNLPKLSYKEREKSYRKHLMEKYGQNLS